jgi:hypothetical protein
MSMKRYANLDRIIVKIAQGIKERIRTKASE